MKRSFGFIPLVVLVPLVLVLLAVGFLFQNFFGSVQLRGDAEVPYVFTGERLAVAREAEYRRGDLVLMRVPESSVSASIQPRPRFVKRIVAVGGDRVRMVKGQLYLNGNAVDESYTVAYWKARNQWDRESSLANSDQWYFRDQQAKGDLIIPVNHVFVLGDNRSVGGSEDSRVFGPVQLDLIEGRATGVRWPLRTRMYEFKARLGDKQWSWWLPVERDYTGKEVPNQTSVMRSAWRTLERPEVFQRLENVK